MKKILIIDDDHGITDAISLLLEDMGYLVKSTIKASEVNILVHEFQPDLILLDVLLSGVDGREICKSFKENNVTQKIPIIMMSAHPSVVKNISAYGADDFLAKPFETDVLLKKIQSFFP